MTLPDPPQTVDPPEERRPGVSPEDPPAPGDPVEARARDFLDQVQTLHTAFSRELVARTMTPIMETAARSATLHAELLSRLDASGEVGEERPPPEVRVDRYLTGLLDRVMDPLVSAVEASAAEPGVDVAWMKLREGLREAAGASEARLVRGDPAGRFDPDPRDSGLVRMRKALVRARRGLRPGRAGPGPGGPGSAVRFRQVVPFRHLALWHVDVRLLPLQEEWVRTLLQRTAGPASSVHAALSRWIDQVVRPLPLIPDAGAVESSADAPEGPPSLLQRILAEGFLLQDALLALGAEGDPGGDPPLGPFPVEGFLERSEAEFAADLRAVHSFLLPLRRRSLPARPIRPLRELRRLTTAWAARNRDVAGAVEVQGALLRLRRTLQDERRGLSRQLSGTALEVARRLAEGAATLRTLSATVDAEPEAGGTDGAHPGEALQARWAGVAATGGREVERLASDLRSVRGRARVLAEAEDRGASILQGLNRLPDERTVHLRPGPALEPFGRGHGLDLRNLALRSFDALVLEGLRTGVEPLSEVLETVERAVSELPDVIRFNFEAATQEAASPEGSLGEAGEMARSGLLRPAETLDRLAAEVHAALRTAVESSGVPLERGWAGLLGRLAAEDRIQEHLMDARDRFNTTVRGAVAGGRRMAESGRRRLSTGWSQGRSRMQTLIRLGQTAVQGEQVTEEGRRRTLETLLRLDVLLSDLPVVYRRLFLVQPVGADLLAHSRHGDLAVLADHIEQWKDGLTDAVLVSGERGSGLTSFLDTVEARFLGGDTPCRRLALRHRPRDEEELVELLAPLLQVEERIRTLEDLAGAVPREQAGGPPRIVLEGLEFLLFRTASGNGLLGPFLDFLSRTDNRVIWVGGIGRWAWSYLERVDAATAGLVRHHPLETLSRDELESVFLRRHARSGLPLIFLAPDPPPQGLRRRLRRAADEEERQAILRREFFDRLHRSVGASLTLALFHWLSAAHLSEDGTALCIHPFRALGFGFLDQLTVVQSGTLRALLEHGSLTREQHDQVFGIPPAESRTILASLGNLLLVEPDHPESGLLSAGTAAIRGDEAYRVPALLVHPVKQHLRGRNMGS